MIESEKREFYTVLILSGMWGCSNLCCGHTDDMLEMAVREADRVIEHFAIREETEE